MVLGARLRTVMSSIIRWRKAEILPAGGIEYAEGLVLLIASNGTGKRRPTPSWRSSNQVSVRLAGRGKRTPGPGQRRANPTGRVSTLRDNLLPSWIYGWTLRIYFLISTTTSRLNDELKYHGF